MASSSSLSSDQLLYQPLSIERDEIRLLHLQPEKDLNAPLRGHLAVVRLDEVPQFQSLSYVWGQSSIASEPLRLNNRALQITANLEAALRNVRQRNVPLPLWCDRVCINQNDLEERNHQVHLMRRVFVSTVFVNIWLGPGSAGAKDAFTTLSELASGRPMVDILQHRSSAVEYTEDLIKLFSYPWWQRLWTIQEALLAQRALVQCGSCMIELETIMQAFELLWNQLVQQVHVQALQRLCGADVVQALTRQLEVTVRRLHVTRSLILSRPRGQEPTLRDDLSKWPMVMHTCAWSNATDPRDKVYGTFGLFPSSFLEVDYSLSLRQTYSRSTFAMIKRLGNLAVLTQTTSQVSIDNGLTSWVPDWRNPHKETASLLVFYSYFQAGRNIPMDAELLEDEVLQLSAEVIDQIVEIGEIYDDKGSETIKELVPLLEPTLEDWLRLACVPNSSSASFLESFTGQSIDFNADQRALNGMLRDFQQNLYAPPTPPSNNDGHPYLAQQSRFAPVYKDATYATMVPDRSSQQNPYAPPSNHDGPAYHPQQSAYAPVYKDSTYATAALDRGAKRKAEDPLLYMAPQSQSAPVYRDATYSNSTHNVIPRHASSSAGPRSYDPFSHTYGQASSAPLAPSATSTRQAKDSGGPCFNGTPASEVFWRTLCMDIVEDPELKKHRRCKTSDSWRIWEWLDWVFGRGDSGGTIPQLHWHLTTQLQGKRLVKTKKGYLGLAGREAMVGDQIWILAGGAYPYVLRRDGDSDEERTFRCVSTAYVHGFVDGDVKGDDLRKIKIS